MQAVCCSACTGHRRLADKVVGVTAKIHTHHHLGIGGATARPQPIPRPTTDPSEPDGAVPGTC